jgi:hypothetical protein
VFAMAGAPGGWLSIASFLGGVSLPRGPLTETTQNRQRRFLGRPSDGPYSAVEQPH